MTVLRSPIYSPLRSPLRSPLTRLKGGGGDAIPATAIRQRDGGVIRDRAGNTIQVRS